MTFLGHHRLLRLLGRGGMGEVYEAEHELLHRRVALKVLSRELNRDPIALKRFLREAQSAARLNHPNIVAVYEVGQQGDTHFIAMELVNGGSAADYLTVRGAMHWLDATRVIADVCKGLEHAHAHGVVHRDIKPGNIIRSRDDGTVKLGDFGLAKPQGGEALTQIGETVGTPHYMSPEQAHGGDVDARSDLYSLGATYYTLLTGQPPFDAQEPVNILLMHVSHAIPDPRSLNPLIDVRCSAVVKRLLAKEPRDRYASATELQLDLEAILTGSLARVERPTGWLAYLRSRSSGEVALPSTQRLSRRRSSRVLIAGGIGAAIVLSGLSATAIWYWTRSRGPDVSSQNPDVSSQNPGGSSHKPVEEPIRPEQVMAWVDKVCTVEMKVQGIRKYGSTYWFLNSRPNFRHPDNFTVVINTVGQRTFREQGVADFEALQERFAGQTIRVRGTVTLRDGKPQMMIADAQAIRCGPTFE